jgi:hypothetical protein
MERRVFLKNGMSAVAASTLAPTLLAVLPRRSWVGRRTRQCPGTAEFRECIGTRFFVRDETWKSVVLVEVKESDASVEVEQFSCVF